MAARDVEVGNTAAELRTRACCGYRYSDDGDSMKRRLVSGGPAQVGRGIFCVYRTRTAVNSSAAGGGAYRHNSKGHNSKVGG